jgi:predicted DNA-binding transcriptional regulator YafY
VSVLATSGRLLQLLSFLQARREWSGGELAERLEVSRRTVRRDVERLRALGYPVVGMTGVAGGYRLAPGSILPPLLLDDEEAVAIAIGLRTAAASNVAEIEQTSLHALVKLEQVLPARLRRQVQALQSATVPLVAAGPTVAPEALAVLARACRDHERVRFEYRRRDETVGVRLVEPHHLVVAGRRWYLLAYDLDRADWRTFRVDRLADLHGTAARFAPRQLPGSDPAAYVADALASGLARYRALVTLHAPIETAADRLGHTAGLLERIDDHTCLLRTGADSLDGLAIRITMLGIDFEVHEPPELADHLRGIRDRIARALGEPDAPYHP